jgi:hypothetical protein
MHEYPHQLIRLIDQSRYSACLDDVRVNEHVKPVLRFVSFLFRGRHLRDKVGPRLRTAR